MIDSNDRDPQVLATAFHEAGHVMAALQAGRKVREMSVSFDHPGDGFIALNKNNTYNPFYPGQSSKSVLSAWNFALENVRKEMRILLSGPIAEAQFLGGEPLRLRGADDDRIHCRYLVNRVDTLYSFYSSFYPIPLVQGHNVLNETRVSTSKWISHPKTWTAILAIAVKAAQVGTLDGSEISNLIGIASGSERQLALNFS